MSKAKELSQNARETLQAKKTEEIKEESSFDNVSRYFVKLRRSQNNDLEIGHVDRSNIVDKSTIEKFISSDMKNEIIKCRQSTLLTNFSLD